MEKLLVISNLEQLKSISDPFRLELLSLMSQEPQTGQMLADALDIPRAKVHYHLNQLLQHNIITVAYTMEKNSIIQKFYEPAAETIVPSINILSFNQKKDDNAPAIYNITMTENEYKLFTEDMTLKDKNTKAKKETATDNGYAVCVFKNMREA